MSYSRDEAKEMIVAALVSWIPPDCSVNGVLLESAKAYSEKVVWSYETSKRRILRNRKKRERRRHDS